jgi:hypothetical protein
MDSQSSVHSSDDAVADAHSQSRTTGERTELSEGQEERVSNEFWGRRIRSARIGRLEDGTHLATFPSRYLVRRIRSYVRLPLAEGQSIQARRP